MVPAAEVEARAQERRRKKGRGQFFTPTEVALQLLLEAGPFLPPGAAPGGTARVVDPACGEGVFLEAAVRAGWAVPEQIVGADLDRAVLAGPEGSQLHAGCGLGGGLGEEGSFDAALGNPPYGGRGLRDRSAADQRGLAKQFGIWRADVEGRPECFDEAALPRFSRFPVATLFVERFVRLVRPGGVVGILLPQSFFSNRREAPARAWLLRQVQILALIDLPGSTFAGTGTRARTTFLWALRRAEPLARASEGQADPQVQIRRWELGSDGTSLQKAVGWTVSLSTLLDAGRWDPRYHAPGWGETAAGCRLSLRPLGDFVHELCYGAIRVGLRPEPDPQGTLYVTQRAVADWGVNPEACPRIRPGAPFDRPRYRLQPGDLVVPRCGRGTLGQNRMTRWDGAEGQAAVVDCFTDRLALRGLSSAWVLGVLRGPLGWSQIDRLLNGVGTPNLSFGELRSLQIPIPPEAVQEEAEALWTKIAARTLPFEVLRSYVDGVARGTK